MYESVTMNETHALQSVASKEAQTHASVLDSLVAQTSTSQTNDTANTIKDVPKQVTKFSIEDTEEDMEAEPDEVGVRNVRHLPKEDDNTEEDRYQADENTRIAVMTDPDTRNNQEPAQINDANCNSTTCYEPNESSADSQESVPSLDLSERRLFGVNSLTDEVRRLRNQRNRLLSRANLKRRKKRKKGLNNSKSDLQKSKISQTRQGSSTQQNGATNTLSNSLRHHFASQLQFPSVQKMIMSKLNRPQPSASNQHQTRVKPTNLLHSVDTNPSQMQQDLFFQHPSGAFVDHQQQNSEALNQWVQSESMPFQAQQNGAKLHHQITGGSGGGKMIPIEIIGLDPTVTKSILHSDSQIGGGSGSEAQADMSQMYATGNSVGGSYTAEVPLLSSEIALKDHAALQAAKGLRGSGGQALSAPTERPIASSILHIHHFHTQAKPGEMSQPQQQQQVSATNAFSDEHQQQHQQEYGGSTVVPAHLRNPPTDNAQPTIKQHVAGQQQVFLNDKGEMVYLAVGSAGDSNGQQADSRLPQMSDNQDTSSGEQQTSALIGAKQLAQQQQVSGDDLQQNGEAYGAGIGEQAASSVIQQQQYQQRQNLHQFINREPGNSSGSTDSRASRFELSSSNAPKQRVFLTTNGQMISVMTPGNSQQSGDAMGDDKLLMVAYKPQHLQNFKNITDDSVMGVRTPYNEGQESQSSLISASGQHLVLKNPSLLIKNTRYQQPDGSLADSIAQQLATLSLRPQQSGLSSVRNNKLPIGGQILNSEQASLSRGQQSTFDNQSPFVEANGNYMLKSKPSLAEGNGSGDTTASGFPTWLKNQKNSDEKQQLQQSNGYGGNVFSPIGTFNKNNTMNFPTSVLYKQQSQRQQSNVETSNKQQQQQQQQLQRIPLIAALTQSKVSSSNGTTSAKLMSNDLFAGLLNELKLKNSPSSSNYTSNSDQHLTRANTTFDFEPVNVSTAHWDHLMPNYVGNLMLRNSSGNQPRKVLSPYDNVDKRQRINNLLDPSHENGGLREAQAKQHQHQSVGLAPEESDIGDSTNGLSNLALAFIFVVSLLTLTIIAASMIYRHRRRSIGRCVDLPSKTGLNLKQKTKRFVFNNFRTKNQEVASIKSINLNIADGSNNNLTNKSSPKSNDGSNGRNGGCALMNGNTMTKNNRSERISVTQTFGLAPMSTFAGTSSPQFTDDSAAVSAASDIKTIKTRLQKPSYLKSLISTPECPVKLANQKQQAQKQGKSNADGACYLDITKHKSSPMKPPKTRSPNGQGNSFSKKTPCDVHKQNYNFAFAKPAPSELSYSGRISTDSRMHSDRMSTIHSINDTNDSKSTVLSTCEAHGPFKRASNISCRAAKLGNLMAPKHLVSAQLPGPSRLDSKGNISQMDRL